MATVEKKPDSPIVLMIDIETLSLKPTAMVTQIGYCIGDVMTGAMLSAAVSLPMLPQEGDVDLDTLKWWYTQDQKVARGVFDPFNTAPQDASTEDLINRWLRGYDAERKFSPERAFEVFKTITEMYGDITVYGSPAMYDLPILTSMWGGKKPWKYNSERDMMTLYKLLDPRGVMAPPENGLQHDAAADAQWQMEYLMRLRKALAALTGV